LFFCQIATPKAHGGYEIRRITFFKIAIIFYQYHDEGKTLCLLPNEADRRVLVDAKGSQASQNIYQETK
jgi:hypothetical protein